MESIKFDMMYEKALNILNSKEEKKTTKKEEKK